MSYTVKTIEKKYCIIEEETDHNVQCFKNEKIARQVCRNLNLGSGFQGWTPAFFCEKSS